MDGSTIDHSDSDSGDSWTILEHSPAYGDDAPEFTENSHILERETADSCEVADSNIDKDEDTDGISIISDSEPESSTPCEMMHDKFLTEESRPTELPPSQFISFDPLPPNSNNNEESIGSEEDFLGDNTGKHKTYVHRRNKRLSTVLNIIMLGSVITAAGVAIGHMWGARNECSVHTTPSINKILSNLYKLQEENTYLRNKLKELTLVSSLQLQHRKINAVDKITFKQQRCKKIYEEPLNNKNPERITKCIDNEINLVDKNLNNHLVQPEFEKEFIRDVEKLKHIYQQNRSWLDDEVTKRIKHEEEAIKKMVKSPLSSITEEHKVLQDEPTKNTPDSVESKPVLSIDSDAELLDIGVKNKYAENPVLRAKKITYADSLKSEQQAHNIQKRDINKIIDKDHKDFIIKKKAKKDKDVTLNDINFSEEELKKDDRYTGQKHKQEKKKRDRQKLHKKQKRRNKYEQWEMKGGYMKDYDDFSITSLQENDNVFKKPDGNQLSRDFEKTHYINQFSETESTLNIHPNNKPKEIQVNKKLDKSTGKNGKSDDVNWFDKRAALRTEARKKLEHELFGETSPNNAGWYFRRMQKREQCRAKSDNSTYKKLSKRNMNFKMKH
ncbi:uncharacterized protein LOC142979082 [Anticarsia gemmatalis]|uniref:uncharacterized protein LOC142979082 n=1 Tax=Anticarsia gemmatalis TaxID=129554 RepID=UPI003F76A2AD